MVIRRFVVVLSGCSVSVAVCAGCYQDNCADRVDCPYLDEVESGPGESSGDEPGTMSTSTSPDEHSVNVYQVPEPLKPATVTPQTTIEPVSQTKICTRDGSTIADGCGIFVSSSKGKDDWPGTMNKPVRTLKQAMDLAAKGTRVVFPCAETFWESVVLPSGFKLIGGLDCEDDWESIGFLKKTEIIAPPGLSALIVEPGDDLNRIVDIHMEAVDAVEPGGSSIAAWAFDGTKADFIGCEFVAGNGARGKDGSPGDPNAPIAKGGPNGLFGATACSGDAPDGGDLVFITCEDGVVSAGGLGGPGGAITGWDGTSGFPEPFPNLDGMGLGGIGEQLGSWCSAGLKGKQGTDGIHGVGASGVGMISPAGYIGISGGDGTRGTPGQGGGGGGGARGGLGFCGNKPKGGAGGGSGGAGGCGGRGGLGGMYGGASIALVIGDAEVSVKSTLFITGDGGDGGTGGMFQIGGQGGAEGHGGIGYGGSQKGCSGGPGGRGGNGGYGGGGLGGPSVAVIHKVDEPDVDVTLTFLGSPGKGGIGGNPNISGSKGADGAHGELLILPDAPNPAEMPDL